MVLGQYVADLFEATIMERICLARVTFTILQHVEPYKSTDLTYCFKA